LHGGIAFVSIGGALFKLVLQPDGFFTAKIHFFHRKMQINDSFF
jgi:hypothetical protein